MGSLHAPADRPPDTLDRGTMDPRLPHVVCGWHTRRLLLSHSRPTGPSHDQHWPLVGLHWRFTTSAFISKILCADGYNREQPTSGYEETLQTLQTRDCRLDPTSRWQQNWITTAYTWGLSWYSDVIPCIRIANMATQETCCVECLFQIGSMASTPSIQATSSTVFVEDVRAYNINLRVAIHLVHTADIERIPTDRFQMLRKVLGDHAYITGRSHQQVLSDHHHAQPMEILFQLALQQWNRLQQRQHWILPDDFLHRVDWTHLQDTLQLIQTVATQSPEVPIGPSDADLQQMQVRYHCSQCDFSTHSIPNLRRHNTTVHEHSQYRTCAHNILAMSMNGKPQCTFCHKHFTTWRRFRIHIERNCCQASQPSRPRVGPDCPVARTSRAEMSDYHVTTQPFWPDLKDRIQRQAWTEIADLPDANRYLSHSWSSFFYILPFLLCILPFLFWHFWRWSKVMGCTAPSFL